MAKTKHFLSILGGMIIALLCIGGADAATAKWIYANRLVYELKDLVECREGTLDEMKACLNWDAAMADSRRKCEAYGWPQAPNANYCV